MTATATAAIPRDFILTALDRTPGFCQRTFARAEVVPLPPPLRRVLGHEVAIVKETCAVGAVALALQPAQDQVGMLGLELCNGNPVAGDPAQSLRRGNYFQALSCFHERLEGFWFGVPTLLRWRLKRFVRKHFPEVVYVGIDAAYDTPIIRQFRAAAAAAAVDAYASYAQNLRPSPGHPVRVLAAA
jgi:hypothetical protein